MLLALTVLPQIICLLQFKVIISAVVVEYVLPSLYYLLAVLIELRLDVIVLFGEDGKGAVNIVQFK